MSDTSARGPLRWAESIGACGSAEQRIIEIDVAVPGQTEWEPMEMTVQEARVLYAMLGDALADEHPGRDAETAVRRLYSVPPPKES